MVKKFKSLKTIPQVTLLNKLKNVTTTCLDDNNRKNSIDFLPKKLKLMRLFNIKFLKNKKLTLEEKNHSKKYDQYCELGKLVKEARIQKNLSVKELSKFSKIPESTINSIENNIEDLRPRDPFLRSILFKLEKCLSLKNNTLVGLEIKETNTFQKNKKNYILRKFDFLDSWQGSFFYFLFLILILFFLNRYFISNMNIIEIQIIEEKGK